MLYTANNGAGDFAGQEYLGLYPYVEYGREENEVKEDFWVYDQESDNHITLRNWFEWRKNNIKFDYILMRMTGMGRKVFVSYKYKDNDVERIA